MKTNQFIKEIRLMGFHTKDFEKLIIIVDSNDLYVAKVSKVSVGEVSTDYPGFTNLEYSSKLNFLDFLLNYATMPIEDREEEEEEKYKLKQKGISGKYLIWIPEIDKFTTGIYPYKNENVKTVFTQEEIDNMPECYTHPAVWEKIKVERED